MNFHTRELLQKEISLVPMPQTVNVTVKVTTKKKRMKSSQKLVTDYIKKNLK